MAKSNPLKKEAKLESTDSGFSVYLRYSSSIEEISLLATNEKSSIVCIIFFSCNNSLFLIEPCLVFAKPLTLCKAFCRRTSIREDYAKTV